MSSSRAFKDAATTLLAGGSTFSRLRVAPTLRASTPLRNVRTPHLFPRQRATANSASRGYASISTNTTPAPSSIDSTIGLTPGARVIIATTRGVRNVLIFATSTLGLVLFAFTGTHAYLEQYKCPSPAGVSTEVQRCLHGAWVREEISPDPDVAEVYLQKAVELARKDLETFYANKNKGKDGGDERLAFLEIEKDQALIEIQNRLARFYGRIGRDEQAATVWTRLWKLSEKEDPRSSTLSERSSSGLGSLFGGGASADRPLISQKDGILYAKSAADCWMRMGEYEMAEEALAWTLSTLASTAPASAASTTSFPIEEIGLLSTLGALYVRQAKFEYALSLFVKALQAVQDHRASQTSSSVETTTDEKKKAALKEDNDMWYCREAILTQSIGETLYGAATRSSTSTSSTTTTTIATPETTETKKSSSWKFWSSSSSSPSSSSSTPAAKSKAVPQQKSPQQIKKEEEALGWMQKALAMAKAKSGQHRDCDECAALGLNNLGLINEMEGKSEVALAQFKEAVLHATLAKDYVGIDDYNKNIARLTDADSESTPSKSTLA
ncbi:hypothetical protein F5H01DRAFT_413364 [Linnemannia elongata]|nr:hypothetical protein F5H01DRAFT_413364 [Linnemannia elongata]